VYIIVVENMHIIVDEISNCTYKTLTLTQSQHCQSLAQAADKQVVLALALAIGTLPPLNKLSRPRLRGRVATE